MTRTLEGFGSACVPGQPQSQNRCENKPEWILASRATTRVAPTKQPREPQYLDSVTLRLPWLVSVFKSQVTPCRSDDHSPSRGFQDLLRRLFFLEQLDRLVNAAQRVIRGIRALPHQCLTDNARNDRGFNRQNILRGFPGQVLDEQTR